MELVLTPEKFGKYLIKDKKDKVLYICKSKGFNYYIYDENELQLAEVKYNIFSRKKYKLYMNGSLIDETEIDNKIPKGYLLTNKKWYISSDITYSNFDVKNEKGEIMVNMKNDLSDDPYKWNINISTSEKLLAIISAITILSISKK